MNLYLINGTLRKVVDMWRFILAGFALLFPFVSHIIYSENKQRKIDKAKGCTCSFWSWVDVNCPVHNPFYIRYYKTSDGRVSADTIYASNGAREPICDKCLQQLKPKGYEIAWPFEPNESWCHSCNQMKQIRLLPARDLYLWRKAKEVNNQPTEVGGLI